MSFADIKKERNVDIEQQIRQVLTEEADRLSGHRVLLFGSRATDSAGDRSDYDLGVWGDEPLDLETFYRIEEKFEELPTLREIDWLDLNRAPRRLRENAVREGRVIYEG